MRELIIALVVGFIIGMLVPISKAQDVSEYCYPVDMKSGQQMCVRQVFIPTEP